MPQEGARAVAISLFKDFNFCKCLPVDVIFFIICFADTQIALDRKLAHASKDLRQVRLLTISCHS